MSDDNTACANWVDGELERLGVEKSLRDKISGPLDDSVAAIWEMAFHLGEAKGCERGLEIERKRIRDMLRN